TSATPVPPRWRRTSSDSSGVRRSRPGRKVRWRGWPGGAVARRGSRRRARPGRGGRARFFAGGGGRLARGGAPPGGGRAGTGRADAEQAATERAVEEDLREMAGRQETLSWPEARAALERARGRLGDRGSPGLRRRLDQGERDLALAAQLDDIRLDDSGRLRGP